MEKYIALLRGVNVGGKNKVAMPILKEAFEDIGFINVKTYINSGNVVFCSDIKDTSEIELMCKSKIAEKFMLDIPVAIILADELSDVLNNAPEWWDIDKESINYAIFVLTPVSVEEVFLKVGEIKPEFEKIAYHGNVIFWSAPAKTFSKTRYSKIASSAVNNNVTIRNANTVNKLFKLALEL